MKYQKVSSIDLVEIDKDVIDLSKRYLKNIGEKVWKDIRLKINIFDGMEWVKKIDNNYYDIILVDCSDPKAHSNVLFSLGFFNFINFGWNSDLRWIFLYKAEK